MTCQVMAEVLRAGYGAGMTAAVEARGGVGELLRAWRVRRRLSQLDLACEADVSTRHLSYVETGRARPSRGFVLRLADHLEIPLRARNDLLVAAGYAPVYGETDLDSPQMAEVNHALELVLGHHDPYPAIVVDRMWNLVRANDGAELLMEEVSEEFLSPPINVLRLSLHPKGMAPRLDDFATLSGHLLGRLRRQVALSGDEDLAALYDELAGYPGVLTSEPWDEHPGVVLPFRMRSARGTLSFFTTAATFGTAADVTLAELTVEQFFPADDATRRAFGR